MQVWCAARSSLEMQDPKNRHLSTIAQHCLAISSQLRHVSTIGKNLLNSNTSSTCPDNMVNFGPLTAEISSGVWDTPANFNGFRVLAALVHGTLVLGVSQTLRSWTEGTTYIWQGGHHVGHWPTFLVIISIRSSILHSQNNYSMLPAVIMHSSFWHKSLCQKWELFFIKPEVQSIDGISGIAYYTAYYLSKC